MSYSYYADNHIFTMDEIKKLVHDSTPGKMILQSEVINYRWVTPLIRRVRLNGQVHDLKPKIVNGLELIGGGYPRVSTLSQRADGHSADEQIESAVEGFVAREESFKIYSDIGLSGSLPYDDPELIDRMIEAKVKRWSKHFKAIFLSPVRRGRYTPAQEASVLAYLAAKIQSIRSLNPKNKNLKNGRKQKLVYRPGLTAMMLDRCNLHTIASSDVSRLSRDQHLLAEMAHSFRGYPIKFLGTMESLDFLNEDDEDDEDTGFGNEITAWLLGKYAEKKLKEVLRGSFIGLLGKLEKGIAYHVPDYMERDPKTKKTKYKEGAEASILAMLDVYQNECRSTDTCARWLNRRSVWCPSDSGVWTRDFVEGVLISPILIGKAVEFGLEFDVHPRLISEERRRVLLARYENRLHKTSFDSISNGALEEGTKYAGRGLMRCICGGSLIYQTDGKDANEGYVCSCGRNRPGQLHIRMQASNVHHFINGLMATDPVILLGGARGKADLESLHHALNLAISRLEEAKAHVSSRRSQLKPETEVQAAATGISPGDKSWDALVDLLLSAKMDQEKNDEVQRLETEVLRAEKDITEYLPQQQVASVEERMKHWSTLDANDKNEVLHHVFQGWYLRDVKGAPEKLEMLMVLRGGGELPPVPVEVRRSGLGFKRRLPDAHDWVRSVILAHHSKFAVSC